MTYDALVTAAAADVWKRRVKASLAAAAIAITVDAPATPLDSRRDRLGRAVLNEPDVWTNRFALAVALGFLAGADLLVGTVSDAQVDTRVASVWNDFLEPAAT